MSNTKPPKKYAEALIAFCKKIGIDEAEAKRPEDLFAYKLNKTGLPAGQLASASEDDYTRLKDVFGRSLTLEIGRPNDPYILIKQGESQSDFAAGLKRVKQSPTTELDLKTTINKTLIVEQLGLDEALYNCLFYLFEQNLSTQLDASLLGLDVQLFAKPGVAPPTIPKPIVIVVSDADLYLSGKLLTIVGEGRLGEAAEALTPLSAATQEQIKEYQETMKNPTLIGQEFKHLTPLHFSGQWKKKGSDALVRKLARHFLNICILYTANRSTFDSKAPAESVYNNSERTTTLSLKDAPTDEIKMDSLNELEEWLHSGKGADRRTVFQNIIARALYSDDATINYNSFVTRLRDLLVEAQWHYKIFIEGKITKHFEEVQKVVGYVADVNKKISDTIDSVTKSLADTLIATVGVLVLTVLAALVKKDTSVEIFRISMQIYSAYLIFYAIYRMGSILDSYRLLSRDADTQMNAYKIVLGENKVNNLKPPLTSRRCQFHRWFWSTSALYLLLAGAIFWAGIKGPKLLSDWGILGPTPVQTPGAAPPAPSAGPSGPQSNTEASPYHLRASVTPYGPGIKPSHCTRFSQ